MIKSFKNTQTRDSAVIHKGIFEQIKMLHEQNATQAGELAISAIELVLTGEISSDDFMVKFALENYKPIASKNKERYEKSVEASKQARINKLKLVEIADMLNNGASQKIIADTLGEPATTINYRVKIIEKEFPELLKKYENTKNTKLDNDNDNDNDNEDDNEFFTTRFSSNLDF